MTTTRKAPITRDPAKTRARILKAAIAEFSAKGYSGARTEQIVKRARSNIRMLYHYFGSKEALYLQVLEAVLGDLRQKELQLDFDAATPMDGILQMFDFIDTHFAAQPELRALLAYENLNRAQHMKRSERIRDMASPVIVLIGKLLARGVADGSFRTGIDPLRLYIAMVSLAYYAKAHAPTLSRIFDADLAAPDWQAAQKVQTQQMLGSWLAGPASVTATPIVRKTRR